MPRPVLRWLSTARSYETWWTELYSGVLAAAIGIYTISGAEILPRSAIDHAMRTHQHGTEWFWFGAVFGPVQFAALLVGNKAWRWCNGFLMAAWWSAPVILAQKLQLGSSISYIACLGWWLANLTTVVCLFPPKIVEKSKSAPNED